MHRRLVITPSGSRGRNAERPISLKEEDAVKGAQPAMQRPMSGMSAEEIREALDLEPHPEGGWYRETWRADALDGIRPTGTAIYFLLAEGMRSHWHRVDAAECWHFYAGAPLTLRIASTAEGPAAQSVLGAYIADGQRPQIVVPPGCWQSAETMGDWTLAGCTVSPGFLFEGFEMSEPGFDIPG